MNRSTQCSQILRFMARHGSITSIQAIHRLGCLRLSARVLELKRDGHRISSRLVRQAGKTFARYSLA